MGSKQGFPKPYRRKVKVTRKARKVTVADVLRAEREQLEVKRSIKLLRSSLYGKSDVSRVELYDYLQRIADNLGITDADLDEMYRLYSNPPVIKEI